MAGVDSPDHQQALRHLGPDSPEAGGQSRAATGHSGGSEDQSGVSEVRRAHYDGVKINILLQAAGGEWLRPEPGDRVQPRQREGDDGGVQAEHLGAEEHDLRGV